MIRKLILFVIVSLGVCSAAFAAPPAGHSASLACTKLQASMGATFATTYPSFGSCVSSFAPLDQGNAASANAACAKEQADASFATGHSGKTFDQFYGSGAKGKNAFGQCVSSKVQASEAAEQQATPNPAQSCRTSRTTLGTTTFNNAWGTNANKSNAFGKCVAKTAHDQTTDVVNAATACRTDATVTSPTAAADAFGKCVSAKSRAASAARQQATISAAKTCSALLKANSTKFNTTYKTFGRCVSQHPNG